jgi:hypothetical protein
MTKEEIKAEIEKHEKELAVLYKMLRKLIYGNANNTRR